MTFLGILEDTKLPHVPGTVILDNEAVVVPEATTGRKHGKGKHSHIVLVPQFSDGPNDPLNWSSYQKTGVLVVITFGSCLYVATFGPMLNAGLVEIAGEFQRPIHDITLTGGYQLCAARAIGPLISALSIKYGKRPLFLISSMLGIFGSIIVSATSSYQGLLVGRIVQEFSSTAYETLVISMIGDMYFVHERGAYMSGVIPILADVSNLSSVVCGAIITNIGWKWLFHLSIVFCGIQTLLLILLVPETQYRRDRRFDLDTSINGNLGVLEKPAGSFIENVGQSTNEVIDVPAPKSRFQRMVVFSGTYCEDKFLPLVLGPFAVCTNLAVLWVVVVSGTIVATYVAMSYVIAQVFSPPPYLLTPTSVGYLFLGPFIGGLLGAVVCGGVADLIIRCCSRRNNGIYEPEYRLLLMIGGLLCGAGLIGFGVLCENLASFYATATLHGMVLFACVAISQACQSYALDAFRSISSEVFVAAMMYKNFLYYGLSYFVNDWTAARGPAEVFHVFGGAAFALTLTTPIVLVFGKRYRSFWARHNLMEVMHLKPHAEL